MERRALLAAADHNLASSLRHFARLAPGGALQDDGRVLLFSTSPSWPGPYHNGAVRLDASVPPDQVLDRAEAFFAGRCWGFCVWSASHRDGDLERRALDAGYAQVDDHGAPRMALEGPLGPAVAPAGVVLDEVVDEDGRRDFLAVTVAAYEEDLLPADAAARQLACVEALSSAGVRAVVARAGGEPQAAAMVLVSDGVAGVQLVGTVPAARGRGLGELCTRWAADAGFALGATAVVLEASAMGEPLYRRMGFEEIGRLRWCFGPPARSGGAT